MYRLMQPEDKPAMLALWQSQRKESEEFAKKAIEQFAGEQNVYVAEENDEIVAVALAVPVTLQGRTGNYLYGLCGEGSLILAGLLDYLCAQQKLRGAGFTVAVPKGPEQAALLQVSVDMPLLSVERVAHTYHDMPMELRRGLYRTDTHHYRNDLG